MSDPDDQYVKVDAFIKSWQQAGADLCPKDAPESFDDYLKRQMSISDDMIQELNRVCGNDTLTCEEENSSESRPLKCVPPNVRLVATGLQKAELERRKKFPVYSSKVKKMRKYARADAPGIQYSRALTTEEDLEHRVAEPTALITVSIYKPFTSQMPRGPRVNAIFQVLSSQKLTELRDAMKCSADDTILGEYSENPDMPKDIRAIHMYKSGFFFIDGTFYNDMRDPNCRDYSSHLMKWASEPKRCIGPYNTAKMEDSTFADLGIKLGLPYLYQHQGNCEHLMVFNDIRMLHQEEVQDLEAYPLEVAEFKEAKTRCRLCAVHNARWVTQGSPVTPEDPCFFCDTCFRALHYDQEGRKIMNFKAFPYQQDAT